MSRTAGSLRNFALIIALGVAGVGCGTTTASPAGGRSGGGIGQASATPAAGTAAGSGFSIPCDAGRQPLADLAQVEAGLRTGQLSDATAEAQIAGIEQALSNAQQLAGRSSDLGGAYQSVIDALGLLGAQLNAGASVQQVNPYLEGVDAGVSFVVRACANAAAQASPSVAPSAGTSSGIDPCLVGNWVETGESDQVDFNGPTVELMGGMNTAFTFGADGTELVDFTNSAPLKGSLGADVYELDQMGTIRYGFSATGGTLSFSNADYGSFSESATRDAQPFDVGQPGGIPTAVAYTCSSTALTEDGSGFHASLTRR